MRRAGRVQHGRMKPKAGARPTAEQERYHAWIREQPCLVCRRPSTLHHVTASIYGGRLSRNHWRVVPLCPVHHQIQWGPRESVEALNHGGFCRAYGIDLLREAARLKEEYDG